MYAGLCPCVRGHVPCTASPPRSLTAASKMQILREITPGPFQVVAAERELLVTLVRSKQAGDVDGQRADGGSGRGNWGPAQTHSPRTRATPSCSSAARKRSSSSASSSRETPMPCTSDQPDSKVSSEAGEGTMPWAGSTPANFPVGMGGRRYQGCELPPQLSLHHPHPHPYTHILPFP